MLLNDWNNLDRIKKKRTKEEKKGKRKTLKSIKHNKLALHSFETVDLRISIDFLKLGGVS
jgi:hypothetical protein